MTKKNPTQADLVNQLIFEMLCADLADLPALPRPSHRGKRKAKRKSSSDQQLPLL